MRVSPLMSSPLERKRGGAGYRCTEDLFYNAERRDAYLRPEISSPSLGHHFLAYTALLRCAILDVCLPLARCVAIFVPWNDGMFDSLALFCNIRAPMIRHNGLTHDEYRTC